MAVYRRYNTRRKKINYPLIIWAASIITVLIITAVIGNALGNRAADKEDYYMGEDQHGGNSETLASVIPHIMQALYVEPKNLASFKTEDPSLYASTWLYKDGGACFASEVAQKLGENVSKLPKLDASLVSAPVSGMFEVASVYTDENVKNIIFEYEKALISEFTAYGPDEIVLVYNTLTLENIDSIISNAKALSGAVISVPYTALYEDFFVKFLSAASENGFTVALKVEKLKSDDLKRDIDDYAVYFTRDFLRLMLPGSAAGLTDVLREKSLLNYQFYS